MLSLVESLTTKQANKLFRNTVVRKYFKADKQVGFPGGWWEGIIDDVETSLEDAATGEPYNGLLFHIVYSDGDKEHVTSAELCAILKDKKAMEKKLDAAVSMRPNRQDDTRGGKRQRIIPIPIEGAENAVADTESPHFSSPASHGTSGRGTKRTLESQRDTSDSLGAGGSGGGGAARKSRLGPSATTVAPRPAPLNMVSESETPVPWDQFDQRHVGLPGHLKQVEVIDFMNHENMKMEFNNHVTFVTGKNGSGKSASLQALQLCLGMKASQTGRASSLKTLIKTGANQAILRVTLHNRPYQGYDAFQYERYGDTITVERKISDKGTSTWALKNHRGVKVAERRDDLDAMLTTLGINAANPIAVMTQDTSRSFLAGSNTQSDKEKFQLYMEATQLGAIAENLANSKVALTEMDEYVGKIRAKYEILEAEEKRLADSLHNLSKVGAWQREATELRIIAAWTIVEEHEKAAAVLEAELAGGMPASTARATANVEEKERMAAELKESLAEKKLFLSTYEETLGELGAQQTAAKAAAKAAHKTASTLEKKLKKLEEKRQEEQDKMEGLQKAVEEAASQTQADTAGAVLQYSREVEEANAEARRTRAIIDERQAALKAVDAEVDALRKAVDEATNSRIRAEDHIRNLEADAARMRGPAKDAKLSQFGDGMVNLVKAVEGACARGIFHKRPIGPVGQYLALEDTRWARAVEAAAGQSFSTFLVQDQHDCSILKDLMQKTGIAVRDRPRICVMRLDLPMHHVPDGKQPARNIPTVLRVLRCSDRSLEAPVMNFLIDNARIEALALGTTHDEVRAAARERNVTTAYCVDGSRYYVRGASDTFESEPAWMRGRPARLGTSEGEKRSQIQAAITTAKQALQSAVAAEAEAHAAVETANAAAKAARLALVDARKADRVAQVNKENLLNDVPPEVQATQAASSGGGGDDEIEADIVCATQAVVDFGDQAEEARRDLEAARAVHTEKTAEAETALNKAERLKEEGAQLVSTFEAAMQREREAEAELAAARAELANLEQNRAAMEGKLKELYQSIKATSEFAPRMGSREAAREARVQIEAEYREKGRDDEFIAKFFTRDVLIKKNEHLQKKIKIAEQHAGGCLSTVQEQHKEAADRLEKDGADLQRTLHVHTLLRAAYRRRKTKLQEVDASVETQVSQRFNSYLRKKGHIGRLKLDRQKQALTLSVQIGERQGAGAGAVKDLKQLSGGERSFTTVAFTLALGGETGMPFRAMDEFDVFMDSVNRRVAMENLLTFAREHKELQFVFLTPQDMSAVRAAKEQCGVKGTPIPDEFVKIVAMRPARPQAA